MKNHVIEKNLITFIKNNSINPGLYWVPLIKLKNNIPIIAYDIEAIYNSNDIDLLYKIVDK